MRDTTQLTERAKRDIAYWMDQQRVFAAHAELHLKHTMTCVKRMSEPHEFDYNDRQQVLAGYATDAARCQASAAFAFRMIRYIRDYEDD